jgi:transcriptional regulator with XRE-family HTH domain
LHVLSGKEPKVRDSAFGPSQIPPDFWFRTDVRAALARREFGELYGLLVQRAGLSQTQIGALTGDPQGRISQIINGKHHVRYTETMIRIADGLGMPDRARMTLGLAPAHADEAAPASGLVAGTVYPATTEQAITVTSGLWDADIRQWQELLSAPPERGAWNAAALSWLVGQHGGSLPDNDSGRAVGRADVARVRETTALFAQLDNKFGGTHARQPLLQFLNHDTAALLRGRYTEKTGRELFAAAAEATLLAAWTSYDCGLHGLAQRYFIQALRLAESAADRPLACSIMSAMSHQATYLGHFTDAVSLARAAHIGLRDRATPLLTAQFLTMEARALARSGDTRACHAALAAAERAFRPPEPGRDPEFIAYFTDAELADEIAHCFRDLGDARQAAQHAASATGGQYARSDFFAVMVLADALADQDEPEHACQTALTALQLGETLTSQRCASYVEEFRQRLDRFDRNPAVAAFTEQAAAHPMWTQAA